jgi:hypothetical protein
VRVTFEHLREYLVEIGLLAVDEGAIRESDADRGGSAPDLGMSISAAWQSNSCGHFRGFLAFATFPSVLSTSA